MTKISSLIIRPTVRGLVLALAVAALSSYVARAVPYASCITNNAGNVSYYLNEAATDVKIIFDGGGVGKTNALGAQAKGLHANAFSMAGHTSYKIQVTQIATVGWTRTSDDANLFCAYPSPRGVAVNKISTNLSTFGRIYVSDSLTNGVVASVQRANVGKGIFILNADQSDCLGRSTNASQAGMSFLGGSQSSPWKIDVGQDNKLYVNCFATVDATTWRSDPDCNSFELVLEGVGENVNTNVQPGAQIHFRWNVVDCQRHNRLKRRDKPHWLRYRRYREPLPGQWLDALLRDRQLRLQCEYHGFSLADRHGRA